MARLVLLRTFEQTGAARFEVAEAGHDTTTRQDYTRAYTTSTAPTPIDRDPAEIVGFYCDNTTRVDVYHVVERNGTSRLVRTAGHASCAVTAPEDPTPAGETLLFRAFETRGEDATTQRAETYYSPLTRTTRTVYTSAPAPGAGFSWPPDRVVDAWCIDPAQPPYTERRVYHAGFGTIRFEDVDDVLACRPPVRPPFTLTVTATSVETARGGDGTATITPSGAVATVLYSLDNFQQHSQPGSLFTGLVAGDYTVYAREQLRGGRSAQVSFTITAPRGLRYVLPAESFLGRGYQVRWLLRGYEGEAEELTGYGPEAVRLSWPGSATAHVMDDLVQGSTLEVDIMVRREGQLLDALCADDRAMLVELWEDARLHWRGYQLPDLYDAAHLAPPYQSTLRAADGVGGWRDLPFAGPGGHLLPPARWSVRQVLTHCLSLLGLALPLYTSVEVYEEEMARAGEDDPLAQAYVETGGYRTDKDDAWTCMEVVEAVLEPFAAQLRQADGAFHVRRLLQVSAGTYPRRAYDATGQRQAAVAAYTPLRGVTLPGGALFWLTAAQRVAARPAVAGVRVKTSPGVLRNLLPGAEWRELDFLPDGTLAQWGGVAPHRREEPATKREEPALRLVGRPALSDDNAPEAPGAWLTSPLISLPGGEPFLLTLTATLLTEEEIDTSSATRPRLLVAVQIDGQWTYPNLAGTSQEADPARLYFEKGNTAETFTLFFFTPDTPATAQIRLYQPPEAPDVLIRDMRVEIGPFGDGRIGHAEDYTDEYRISNTAAGRLSELDTAVTLQHTETPQAVLQRSWLRADGRPALRWQEGPTDPYYQLGDFLVRDRQRWQLSYAQVLTGILRGGFSALDTLYEPLEDITAVHLPVSLTWSVLADTWDLAAVELLGAALPDSAGETFRLLLETGDALLLETGDYTLLEYSNG